MAESEKVDLDRHLNANGNGGINGDNVSPSGTYSDDTKNPSLASLETILARDPATTALYHELFPQDSWTPEGVYWADLKGRERTRFINQAQGAEFSKEWKGIIADFKSDPLLPFANYWRIYVLPGMGLFTEGYVLFSIVSFDKVALNTERFNLSTP